MSDYAAALVTKSPTAGSLLAQARATWDRICALDPAGPEAQAGPSMHLTLAFSYACGANHPEEAERLYAEMGEDGRRNIDAIDAREPGSMKIWLRR